ncbi:hypothetical protein ACEWY4_003975 [Coilia grayii]|uniref:Uncharacterized protein n=1 Tax=Coilia grayii TaxID=363190 RepID=A0ABD1KK72_9TELE
MESRAAQSQRESPTHTSTQQTPDGSTKPSQRTLTTAIGRAKMRGVVLVCLLVCAVLLLAKQGEGHVTFFSPKQMKEMEALAKQKELGARSEDGTPEETSDQPVPQEEPLAQGTEVELSIKLSAEQLEHVTQEIIKDALENGAA